MLYFGTRAYLFSPEEEPRCGFLTWNNCCEFLASYGVIIQSVIQSSIQEIFIHIQRNLLLQQQLYVLHTFHLRQAQLFLFSLFSPCWNLKENFTKVDWSGGDCSFLSIKFYQLLKGIWFLWNNCIHYNEIYKKLVRQKKWCILNFRNSICDIGSNKKKKKNLKIQYWLKVVFHTETNF